MSQREETIEKLSKVGEQVEISGINGSDVIDALSNQQFGPEELGALGEQLGKQAGALLGRYLGTKIGEHYATDRTEDAEEPNTTDTDRPDEQSTSDSEEIEGEREVEPERTEKSAGSFENMSDDELQSLANNLMDELDRRQSNDS